MEVSQNSTKEPVDLFDGVVESAVHEARDLLLGRGHCTLWVVGDQSPQRITVHGPLEEGVDDRLWLLAEPTNPLELWSLLRRVQALRASRQSDAHRQPRLAALTKVSQWLLMAGGVVADGVPPVADPPMRVQDVSCSKALVELDNQIDDGHQDALVAAQPLALTLAALLVRAVDVRLT